MADEKRTHAEWRSAALSALSRERNRAGKNARRQAEAEENRQAAQDSMREAGEAVSELEKMASDENYAADQMHKVDTAVKMSRRINELFGFEQNWGNGEDKGTITEIAITFNEDNTISIFANLEKMNEKSREIMQKNAEERAEAKKEEEAKMKSNPYFKPEDIMIKRTRLEASSEEELIDKIMNLDWESVKEVPITIGDKINYSV